MPLLLRRLLIGMVGLVLVSGCAGISPAQVGQTAGTIAGAAIAPGVGAPFGALVGLLAGMVVQGHVDQVTEKRERKELSDQLAVGEQQSALASVGDRSLRGSSRESGTGPSRDQSPPEEGEPTRVWVDETVQDGRLLAGRFERRYLP